MSAALGVSVIVCAYTEDRWDELGAAIASLQRQSIPPDEILIVIDHNPALYTRAEAHFSGVKVLENVRQRGLSGARNSGIAAAQSAIIAFMDEDAIAAPDWIERLKAGYENPQVVGVGGAIEPLWAAGRPGWFPQEFDWVVGCTYLGMPTTVKPIRNLIGCNMSFRREMFDAIGGFRDGIGRIGTRPVGCEETELCIRARQYAPNSLLTYDPQARVQHRVPPQRSTWHYFRSRCYSEGLSKALVARYVGANSALASERAYTFVTLPQGFKRGLVDALTRRDLDGLRRASAIGLGLAITTTGYLVGVVMERLAARRKPAAAPQSSERPAI
ncbi:MAG: glycosyltransferase family 2 protein [Chloroflexi bacterium]|nr:glycosyltransferase family 2 protein [Chloroflexota bacterium]